MLQAKRFDALWTRSGEDHASSCDCSGKVGVLREKPIARNDGVCSVFFGDIDDRISIIIEDPSDRDWHDRGYLDSLTACRWISTFALSSLVPYGRKWRSRMTQNMKTIKYIKDISEPMREKCKRI